MTETTDRGIKMASQSVTQDEWNMSWERIFNRHEPCSNEDGDREITKLNQIQIKLIFQAIIRDIERDENASNRTYITKEQKGWFKGRIDGFYEVMFIISKQLDFFIKEGERAQDYYQRWLKAYTKERNKEDEWSVKLKLA